MFEHKRIKTPEKRDRDFRSLRVNRLINRELVLEIDNVLIALKNLLERQCPAHVNKVMGYGPLLLVAAYAVKSNLDAIRYLLADTPPDPFRKPEFCICVSPNVRFLADLLSTLIIIRQSPKRYCKWYHRSGWRELRESLELLSNEPGSKKKFSSQLQKQMQGLEQMRIAYGISKRDAENFREIDWWPTLGQFLSRKKKTKIKLRPYRFLNYFYTLFYSELSQDVHMSGAGIARMFSKLLIQSSDQDRETILHRIKSNNYMLSLIISVSIATEINDLCRFDRGGKLTYIWKILSGAWADADRLYKKRYKRLVARHLSFS